MALAEFEAKLDDVLQELLFQFGKDVAQDFVNSVFKRHYGVDGFAPSAPPSTALGAHDTGFSVFDGHATPLLDSGHEIAIPQNSVNLQVDWQSMQPGDINTDDILEPELWDDFMNWPSEPIGLGPPMGRSERGSNVSFSNDPMRGVTMTSSPWCDQEVNKELEIAVDWPPSEKHTTDQATSGPSPSAENHDRDCVSGSPLTSPDPDPSPKGEGSSPEPVSCERCGQRLRCQSLRKRPLNLFRDDIIGVLGKYWNLLRSSGLYKIEEDETLQCHMDVDQTKCMQRREYHIILRNLEKQHDLNPWRRAIAEYRTLEYYYELEEQLRGCADRKPGDSTKNLAHRKYVEEMFPGAGAQEHKKHRDDLKRDLQFARRWAIAIHGYEENGL